MIRRYCHRVRKVCLALCLLAVSSCQSPPTVWPQQGENNQDALWLADFETDSELTNNWSWRDVRVTRSQSLARNGSWSARVEFRPSGGASSFKLAALEDEPRLQNWRGYHKLVLDAHNEEESQHRLRLQIRDSHGQRYQESIYIAGGKTERLEIEIDRLADYLDVADIVEFGFYLWKPSTEIAFAIDGIRLEKATVESTIRPVSNQTIGVAVGEDWQVGWAPSLIKTLRDPAQFRGRLDGPAQISLARNERESVQAVVIGMLDEEIEVVASVGPLEHHEGIARLGSESIEIREVGYVNTSRPDYSVVHVGAWPDPLPLSRKIRVPAENLGAFWITVRADAGLPPGTYSGPITLSGSDGVSRELTLSVRVWDFSLPEQPALATAFDLYRGRLLESYEAFVPGGEAWMSRGDELERLYFEDMIKHRISPVIGKDPSDAATATALKELVARGLGNFGVGKRGGTNGNSLWPEERVELREVVASYADAAGSLDQHGLLERAYVYAYDEPEAGLPHTAQVMRALHDQAPRLRTMLAMYMSPDPAQYRDWLSDVDILAVRLPSFRAEHAAQFREQGKEIWMYVSSPVHPYPDLVIDVSALSHRVIPWFARKQDVTGLLYWCVNYWKRGDPWHEPANYVSEQNGNGSLYYPAPDGPVPSLRLAVLRDGIDDYDYFDILESLVDQARHSANVVPAQTLALATETMQVPEHIVASARSYTHDPYALLEYRDRLAETIEELSLLLAH